MGCIRIVLLLAVFILPISAMCQSYYKKVVANIGEFSKVISVLDRKHLLQLDDSIHLKNGGIIEFNNKCLFKGHVSDPQIKDFMEKFDLKRICFSRHDRDSLSSVVSFHKDFSPFFGKAIAVIYDFGKSGLRDMANRNVELKNEKLIIINDMYLYRVRSRPSFGE